MQESDPLRQQLIQLLNGGNAHMSVSEAVADLPAPKRTEKPAQAPRSVWEILAHIRIAQWDILEFVRSSHYESPAWPDNYWPAPDDIPGDDEWCVTLDRIAADTEALKAIVRNPGNDLLAPLPHASEYSILREILTVCDHNSYHIGQIVTIRQMLGCEP